jgi:phospholipase D1/2
MPLDFLKDAEMAEPGLAVNQITEVSSLMTHLRRHILLILLQSIYT